MFQKRVDRAKIASQEKEKAASRLDIARYNLVETDHSSRVDKLQKEQARSRKIC